MFAQCKCLSVIFNGSTYLASSKVHNNFLSCWYIYTEIAPVQQESGYRSLPPSMRTIPAVTTPGGSSTHSVDKYGFKRSVTVKSRKHLLPSTLPRVASERIIDSSATNFPSTEKPVTLPPVTSVVKAPHPPTTSPPNPPLLVSMEPKAEATPIPQLPYSPLQVANLSASSDDAALSKTFAMNEAIGYLHEHAFGQKPEEEEEPQAASNKQKHSSSTGHRKIGLCAEKPKTGPPGIHLQRPRSMSSPIEITSSLTASWVHVPQQARLASTAPAMSNSNASSRRGSASDTAERSSPTMKDLSAVTPKSHSWRQSFSNVLQRLKVTIVGDENSADSEEVQYTVGLGFTM